MENKIQKIISFRISGKYAHFRKFYTNASSLSYLIPPRTTISGMIASILEYPRDEYYSKFDNISISVSLPENLSIRKQTQSINNLHNNYYRYILTGKGKIQHSQCKMELLLPPYSKNICYIIYVAGDNSEALLNDLEKKLHQRDFGYGIYLGQRQFKAYIDHIKTFKNDEIIFLDHAEVINSICNEENFLDYSLEQEVDIISEQMPCHFQTIKVKDKISRRPCSVKKIFFERNGKPIKGYFSHCYLIGGKTISFY